MINDINSDLIRGHINTIILKALFEGDRYGYDICREIETKSNGQYKLKQPTLYSCLRRLETQGFITSYWGGANIQGGRRKYYTLTAQGKDLFVKNQTEWEFSRTVIDRLISDKDFDLSSVSPSRPIINQPDDFDSEEFDDEEFIDESVDESQDQSKDDDFEFSIVEKEFVEQRDIDAQSTEAATALDGFETSTSNSYADKIDIQTIQISKDRIDIKKQTDNTTKPKINSQQTSPMASYAESYAYDDYEDFEEDFDAETTQVLGQTSNKKFSKAESDDEKEIIDSIIKGYKKSDYFEDNQSLMFEQSTNEKAASKSFINSEYRNILGKIFSKNDSPSPVKHHITETEKNISNDDYNGFFEEISTKPYQRSKSGNTAAVKIRTHNKNTSIEYNNTFYYYDRKLKLAHYGLLFGIMLLEIAIVALVLKFGASVTQKNELIYYIIAVLAAVAFPVASIVMYIGNAEHKRKCSFVFKDSLFLRSIIFINAIILVCFLNFWIFKSSLTDTNEYLVSLVLPCVLLTNVPISSLIFNALYSSKKYNA